MIIAIPNGCHVIMIINFGYIWDDCNDFFWGCHYLRDNQDTHWDVVGLAFGITIIRLQYWLKPKKYNELEMGYIIGYNWDI